MDNIQYIAETIKSLAEQRNISINKMLSDCQLNKDTVRNITDGSVPAIDRLQIIAEYFEVSLDYLVGRTNNPNVNK